MKQSNKSQVYNSIVLASDDETVYLTVSSTRFVLSDGVFEVESLVRHLSCEKLTLKVWQSMFNQQNLSFRRLFPTAPGGWSPSIWSPRRFNFFKCFTIFPGNHHQSWLPYTTDTYFHAFCICILWHWKQRWVSWWKRSILQTDSKSTRVKTFCSSARLGWEEFTSKFFSSHFAWWWVVIVIDDDDNYHRDVDDRLIGFHQALVERGEGWNHWGACRQPSWHAR